VIRRTLCRIVGNQTLLTALGATALPPSIFVTHCAF
jgi:hypothetical protein